MGIIYVDSGGDSANNSGTSDNNTADLSGSACTAASTVITLDGSPDLTGVDATAGSATQSAINIVGATNANRTVFWITAKDNTLKTVTVDVAPTGVTTNAWKIGGRYPWPSGAGVNVVEGAMGVNGAKDILQFNNNPASKTVTFFTARIAGTAASGFPLIRGKSGTRPRLTVTNTSNVLTITQSYWSIDNLEIAQTGASGVGITISTFELCTCTNLKISDAGSHGIFSSRGVRLFSSEISGVLGDGLNITGSCSMIIGNYIHDLVGDGMEFTSTSVNGDISYNIIDSCAGRGIFLNAAPGASTFIISIKNNTVYGCGNSGLEVSDIDYLVSLYNNIFQDNGDAAGEYNVEWVAGPAENTSLHGYNCFYLSSGSNNVSTSTFTINSTEITTNPQFISTGRRTFTSSDVNTTAETITITAHGYVLNQVVMLISTTGAVPTGLALSTPYYVIVTDANTIQLSATLDGAAINLTAVGSGTTTISNGQTANFSLQPSSPCLSTAYPGQFLGGPYSYLDMGAVQIQQNSPVINVTRNIYMGDDPLWAGDIV